MLIMAKLKLSIARNNKNGTWTSFATENISINNTNNGNETETLALPRLAEAVNSGDGTWMCGCEPIYLGYG